LKAASVRERRRTNKLPIDQGRRTSRTGQVRAAAGGFATPPAKTLIDRR